MKKSEQSWKRCTKKQEDPNKVPDAIIQGLVKLYPELTEEVLIEKQYADFQKLAMPIKRARDRWVEATKYLAKNRGSLADLGKQYYKDVDDVDVRPNLPLIAKKEWRLKKPVELTETSPLPKFEYVVEEQPHRLSGLNVDYHVLRGQLAPKGHRPTDDDYFRLIDVTRKDSGLEFSFSQTSYFQYINSLESTAAELADFALTHEKGTIPRFSDPRVPPEEIYDFKKRIAVAGVNCILLLKNYFAPGGYSDHKRRVSNKFVLHERGENTIEAQNTFNVIPAGGHQPLAEDFGLLRERAIWSTVVREFCEELFNKEDAARFRRHGEDFLDLPEVKPLVDGVFRSGAAKIYLLGLGLDPVTTKPEILVAIVADWARASTKIVLRIDENYEGEAKFHDLTRENLLDQAEMPRRKKPLLPAAKACLLLAAEHYKILMGSA